MNKIEKAISQMEAWANNPAQGYDQTYRWGEKGDYDCSSAVISAWELAGVPVKNSGATYTGNMRSVFLKCGFIDVTGRVNLSSGTGLQRGDVLLHHTNHTAMYCGNGKEVEASINERGRATGGTPGDQTGSEFLIRSYRNYPWQCVLRYAEENNGSAEENNGSAEESAAIVIPMRPTPSFFYKIEMGLLKHGMEHPQVGTLQTLLQAKGFYSGEADNIFGDLTLEAVKAYQEANGLEVDGEVGGQTWSKLLNGER